MASTPIVGGAASGLEYACHCRDECACEVFAYRISGGILYGYVLWQIYRQVGGVWRPSHVKNQAPIVQDDDFTQ